METARHHVCIYHVILIGLEPELNLHLPLQSNSEFPTREIKCLLSFVSGWYKCWAIPPSTAGTFRKKFQKNFEKTPETLSERFLEFRSIIGLGSPQPYNSRHLRHPEHFQTSLPPVRLGMPLFLEMVPERASQSWSWNSQQF